MSHSHRTYSLVTQIFIRHMILHWVLNSQNELSHLWFTAFVFGNSSCLKHPLNMFCDNLSERNAPTHLDAVVVSACLVTAIWCQSRGGRMTHVATLRRCGRVSDVCWILLNRSAILALMPWASRFQRSNLCIQVSQ